MNLTEVRIDEIAAMKYGKMPPKSILSDDGYPIYSGYRITGAAKEYLYKDPMLIVVARGVGGTGDVKISPPEAWITNLSIVLTLNDSVDQKYLFYRLRREALKEKLNTGAAQAQITIENLGPYKIKIHTKDHQLKIASILSSYDDLIGNNQRRIALLEDAARQLYKEWFVHFRFPGHEHVSIINAIPEGWNGIIASEALFINPRTAAEKGKPITYVPMSCLSESGMVVDGTDFEIRTKHTSVRFLKNDTLFARITPCLENGKTGFVNFLKPDEVACGSTEFIVLRGKSVSPYFTYLLSRDERFRGNAIKSMIGSSGRQRVQPTCFDRFVLPVPPSAISEQFDDFVSSSFSQIENLSKQNKTLGHARDLLLPKLMSGEIAV